MGGFGLIYQFINLSLERHMTGVLALLGLGQGLQDFTYRKEGGRMFQIDFGRGRSAVLGSFFYERGEL